MAGGTRRGILKPFLSPRAGGQSISKAVSVPSVVHSARDGLTQNGIYYCRALLPVCLPSPPYLHTVSNQILEVGKAWEQG